MNAFSEGTTRVLNKTEELSWNAPKYYLKMELNNGNVIFYHPQIIVKQPSKNQRNTTNNSMRLVATFASRNKVSRNLFLRSHTGFYIGDYPEKITLAGNVSINTAEGFEYKSWDCMVTDFETSQEKMRNGIQPFCRAGELDKAFWLVYTLFDKQRGFIRFRFGAESWKSLSPVHADRRNDPPLRRSIILADSSDEDGEQAPTARNDQRRDSSAPSTSFAKDNPIPAKKRSHDTGPSSENLGPPCKKKSLLAKLSPKSLRAQVKLKYNLFKELMSKHFPHVQWNSETLPKYKLIDLGWKFKVARNSTEKALMKKKKNEIIQQVTELYEELWPGGIIQLPTPIVQITDCY